jgi:hypothetical protein
LCFRVAYRDGLAERLVGLERNRDHVCAPARVWGSLVLGVGFRVQGSEFRVQGLGFRVEALGSRASGSGFKVDTVFESTLFAVLPVKRIAWFRVFGFGLRVKGLGFRVWGSGLRDLGLGCRVYDSGVRGAEPGTRDENGHNRTKAPPTQPSLKNFLEPDSQRPIAKRCRCPKCASSLRQENAQAFFRPFENAQAFFRPSDRIRVAGASAAIETEMGTSSTEMETESRRRADAVPAHLSSTQESDIIGGAFNSGVFPPPSCPRWLDSQPVTSLSTTAHPNPPCVGLGVRVGVRVVEGVSNAQLPRRAPAQMAKAQRSSFITSAGARSRPRLPRLLAK